METLMLALLFVIGLGMARAQYERARIGLLAEHLGRFQIEKLMATLSDGYLRALGESDRRRQQQVWDFLHASEQTLSEQFDQFAAAMAQADEAQTRVSTLPVSLPWGDRLFPGATFDLRQALAIHARGIRAAVAEHAHESARDRAYRLSAEMFLMQHTCHWYCKSRAVASARLWVRHKTKYGQLLRAVGGQTAKDYRALVGA